MTAALSPGTRPGYVELRFPAKPDGATRAELKAAGFRWAPSASAWYGKASNLPTRYRTEDAPDDRDGYAIGRRLALDSMHPMAAELEGLRDPGEDAADRWNEAQR